ncbi:MAG: site-specific integrase [Chloroflexi bacterium]|nr:site-specific integrase [Chloroflexota bacterium]
MAKRRGRGEGSITQRADGRWMGRLDLGWKDGRRQRKHVYGRTRREVQEQLAKLFRDQQLGLPIADERQTVARFIDRWLEDTARHTLRPSSYDGYANLIRRHITPAIGRIPLAKLTPQHLSALYGTLLDKDLAPRTVQYAHAVIHRALKQAVRWNLVARNVADAVDPPRPNRKEITPLSPEQSRQLLEAARDDRLHALYMLALTTGLRSGELLGLKWRDVDLQNATLHVRRTLGRTSAGLGFGEPKTAKGRRAVALPTLAIAALREHRQRQLEERLQSGPLWQDDDLAFYNRGGRPLERQNIAKRSFKPLLRRAGLPDIRFHDLRHSAATLLLALGEHPKVVQERLGHATIGVTMDVYSHIMPDMQRQAAAKLDRLLGT